MLRAWLHGFVKSSSPDPHPSHATFGDLGAGDGDEYLFCESSPCCQSVANLCHRISAVHFLHFAVTRQEAYADLIAVSCKPFESTPDYSFVICRLDYSFY